MVDTPTASWFPSYESLITCCASIHFTCSLWRYLYSLYDVALDGLTPALCLRHGRILAACLADVPGGVRASDLCALYQLLLPCSRTSRRHYPRGREGGGKPVRCGRLACLHSHADVGGGDRHQLLLYVGRHTTA